MGAAATAAAAVAKPKKLVSGDGAGGGSRPKKEEAVSKQAAGGSPRPSGVVGSAPPSRAPAPASARPSAPPSSSSAPALAPTTTTTGTKKVGSGLPSTGRQEAERKKKAVSTHTAGAPSNLERPAAGPGGPQAKKPAGAGGSGRGVKKKKKPTPALTAATATEAVKEDVSRHPAAPPAAERAEGSAGVGPPAQARRKADAAPVVVPPMLHNAAGGRSATTAAVRDFAPRREGGAAVGVARRPEGVRPHPDAVGGVDTPVLKRLEASLGLMVGSSTAKRPGPSPSANRSNSLPSHAAGAAAATAKLSKRPLGGGGASPPTLDRSFPGGGGGDLAHHKTVGNHQSDLNRPHPPAPSSFGGPQKSGGVSGGGGGGGGGTKRQGPSIPKEGKVPKLKKDGAPRRKAIKKAPVKRLPAGAGGEGGAARGARTGPGPVPGEAAAAITMGGGIPRAMEGHPRWVGEAGPGQYPTFADPHFMREYPPGGPGYPRGPPMQQQQQQQPQPLQPQQPPPSIPYGRIGSDGMMGMVEMKTLPPPLSTERVAGRDNTGGAPQYQQQHDDYGGSSAASGRTWRSGSVASEDGAESVSASLLGDSEDCASVTGSVAGSLAGDGDGDASSSGGRGRSRSRGGRSRGGGRGGGGGGRGSRGGKGSRAGRGGSGSRRRSTEGGSKGAKEGYGLVGKTIKLHRDDVDYPNGRWCVADVQRWSPAQRKYLLSYRGIGSAWLPPGWLRLEDKRKAQVVTVAPAAVRVSFFLLLEKLFVDQSLWTKVFRCIVCESGFVIAMKFSGMSCFRRLFLWFMFEGLLVTRYAVLSRRHLRAGVFLSAFPVVRERIRHDC